MFDQLRIVDELLKKRRIKRAEMLISRQIRRKNGQHALWLVQRARTRLLTGRPAAALDDLLRAQTMQAELFEHVINIHILADCYFARFESSTVGFVEHGDAQVAEQLYDKIISDFSDYSDLGWAFYQRGCLRLARDRVEDAVKDFHTAIEKQSYSTPYLTAYCYERLAFIQFYEARHSSAALETVAKAIDAYPVGQDRTWLVQVYLLKSRILQNLGGTELALDTVKTAIVLAQNTAGDTKSLLSETLFTYGDMLAAVPGREIAALQALEQFLGIDRRPVGIDVTWARTHEVLGDLYFKIGSYAASVAAYNSVLQYNPHYPWEDVVYHRIARSYYHLGNYEKVLEALDHALEMAAADGHHLDYQFYNLYGAACLALKQYERAAHAYEQAISLAFPYGDVLNKLKQYHDFAINRRPVNLTSFK